MSRLSMKSSICKLINETDVLFLLENRSGLERSSCGCFTRKRVCRFWRAQISPLARNFAWDLCEISFLHSIIWNCNRSSQLRFVLAPAPTLASQTLVPQGTFGNQIEVCPQGGAIVEHMSEAIADHGGCALIVDYGEDGSRRHTLRVSWWGVRRDVQY